jgi:signal transduction protein with GAF and PtsI domain
MEQKEKTYFESLYQLVTILNSAGSPDDILDSIVENVAKRMNVKGCSLLLLSPDGKVLLHTVAYGLSDWFVRKGPVSVDESMSETLNGKPVTILDAASDSRIQYRMQVKQEGIASILSVPVKLRENIIGVMRVYTSEPRNFSDADILFATIAANFGAIALESAQFYESQEKDYDTLRQEIRQRNADMGYEWTNEPSVIPAETVESILPPGG